MIADMVLSDARIAARLPATWSEPASVCGEAWADAGRGTPRRSAVCGGWGRICHLQSAGRADGSFTQLGFTVEDIKTEVAALKARGVVFEDYDIPGLETVDGIAEIDGNYPSKGAANVPLGSGTARATCSAWASRPADLGRRRRAVGY